MTHGVDDDMDYGGLNGSREANPNIGAYTAVVPLTRKQRLTGFTVMCLILNRTIGSGIFTGPAYVLKGTGSVAASLFLWAAGSIVTTAGLLVWLELGLSVPRRKFEDVVRGVPRSGGEKNYLEEIFTKPKYLTTCLYGVIFVILGNLSGNAIAFGINVMKSLGHTEPSKGPVLGIAVGALTTVTLVHIFSRRGGIMINNTFACIKVVLLIVMIILGFRFGGQPDSQKNFDTDSSFTQAGPRNVADYVDSFLFVVYTYSGFEQPFYVLAEFRTPRKILPKYSLAAMAVATTLYILLNVAYLWAVPVRTQLDRPESMAILFFEHMFENDRAATRAVAACVAVSILGNIVVMTFTASRVKQEIAKEGIVPWSIFFATATTTPWAHFKIWRQSRMQPRTIAYNDPRAEKSPMAALALHWLSSIVLLCATAILDPMTAYAVLVNIYSYVIILLCGFFVSGGLLFLKVKHRFVRNYPEWDPEFKPWFLINPLHAVLYCTVCGFLLVCCFLKPSKGTPFVAPTSHVKWYITPAIGMSSLLWGLAWYTGLHIKMATTNRELLVDREPRIMPDSDDEDELKQYSEVVTIRWPLKERRRRRAPIGDPNDIPLQDQEPYYG